MAVKSTGTTTRKTTTRKTATTSKAKEVKETKPKATVQVEEIPVKREFKKDDLIPCTSVFQGSILCFGPRTKNEYRWEAPGVTTMVEFEDLRTFAINRRNATLYEPYVLIQDEDFIDLFPSLRDAYKDVFTNEELIDLLLNEDVEVMINKVSILPASIKEQVCTLFSTLVMDGELDSVNRVRALDKIFDTRLLDKMSV